ncbi:ABC-type amino acid transport substrate-binding protein [Rhodoligotrophos appendicifer]|uniref:transporter substrate-binding domain-containing protein n=1 Tax=Rhodoligotrophos appendicifer TaxID=987056 RepID=UPI00117DF385|nr:transporter substrate-binding domain-containing protein [Rhodoligotrophos appendicifer]
MTAKVCRALIALTVMLLVGASPALRAQTAVTAPPHPLVVGTLVAPPFSLKAADGSWSGISIDLWRKMAAAMRVDFRIEEAASIDALVAGTSTGTYDLAVSALTVTAERERILDFTQPFYTTGLGIAVSIDGKTNWVTIMRSMSSFGFMQIIMALVAVVLVIGTLVWAFERKSGKAGDGDLQHGPPQRPRKEMLPQPKLPPQPGKRTSPRFLGVVGMAISLIVLTLLAAAMVSAITGRTSHGEIRTVADLAAQRIGTVSGSAAIEYLDEASILHQDFASVEEGLQALEERRIDAFVYDRPLLAWLILQQFSSTLDLLDVVLDTQTYAIAMPNGSPLREDLNLALLGTIRGEWWKQTLFRYFGHQ